MKKVQTNKIEPISYGKLAWTEPIIGPPEEYADQTESFIEIIKEHSFILAVVLVVMIIPLRNILM